MLYALGMAILVLCPYPSVIGFPSTAWMGLLKILSSRWCVYQTVSLMDYSHAASIQVITFFNSGAEKVDISSQICERIQP